MKKLGLILMLFFGVTTISNAQMTIEGQVADSTCACLSLADSAKIVNNALAVKMQCFSEAVYKNADAIKRNYQTEQRREEDAEKLGIGGSLLISVENELLKTCPIYQTVANNLQSYRESGKAAEKMGEKK